MLKVEKVGKVLDITEYQAFFNTRLIIKYGAAGIPFSSYVSRARFCGRPVESYSRHNKGSQGDDLSFVIDQDHIVNVWTRE